MAIYLVKTPKGVRLIEARTPSAAIGHAVTHDGYSAESLNTTELAYYFKQGVEIENAMPATKVA